MKYQIEATLVKDGGEPVHWQRFSDKALSEKRLPENVIPAVHVQNAI
ncbi:DUF1187 family protein [Arsenophonus apicola]|nr:DUF1187 family protein [Arsenophonus apicola]UBX27931.1 DUF1187 family protein [Arsenophonus apicola]